MNRRVFLGGASALLAVGAARSAETIAPEVEVRAEDLRIQRLSWAGLKLELGEQTVLLDAWTSAGIWDGAWRDPVVDVEVSTRARLAAITHLHNDHFDQELLRKVLAERGSVLCAKEIATTVASRGFRVLPLDLYQPYIFGDFTITPVPASDGTGEVQVSWVVSGGGRRIFHGGDTVWHGHWWRIGRQLGPFDLAFLPINGVMLPKLLPPSGIPASLTPEQAVGAAVALGAAVACPMHYGVTDPTSYVEYPEAEATFLAAARKRGVAVALSRPGERVTWSSPTARR